MVPNDIERYIARRFEASGQYEALALLEAAVLHDGSRPEPRLLRCAAVASGGSLDRLRMEVASLKIDYRDVIVEGEYVVRKGEPVKVHNFLEPIPDEV